MFKKWLKYSILGIIILIIISFILGFWFPILQAFRIVFGMVYLLFLPGFVWTWVFWQKSELDGIERFILSLVLSIALVPLVVFFLNKVGVKINLLNSFLEILGIIVFGFVLIIIQNKKFSKLKQYFVFKKIKLDK